MTPPLKAPKIHSSIGKGTIFVKHGVKSWTPTKSL